MAATIGPLLQAELSEPVRMSRAHRRPLIDEMLVASHGAEPEYDLALPEATLSVLLHLPYTPPSPNEDWAAYEARVTTMIEPLVASAESRGVQVQALVAANAILVQGARDDVMSLAADDLAQHAELNATLALTALDDVPADIDLSPGPSESRLDAGHGVVVAVLDSGIDAFHPALQVADSISVCGEDVDVPGAHGTYCAGIIASRDPVFTGIAPAVTLVNIKTVRADNRGEPGAFARGIDEALRRHADVISVSLGANHLPTWSDKGQGWECPYPGFCAMCRAVQSAVEVTKPPAFVIAAAGNWHLQAEDLRARKLAGSFDTELSCPGQSSAALTVGSISKATFVPATTSSQGPTSYQASKPDICADGVNITSTVPAPRDATGAPQTGDRSKLFARDSGTSAAAAVVAGIAARIIAEQRREGLTPTPTSIRAEILARVVALPYSALTVGAGRARA